MLRLSPRDSVPKGVLKGVPAGIVVAAASLAPASAPGDNPCRSPGRTRAGAGVRGRRGGGDPRPRIRTFINMHRFTIEVFTEGNTDIVNLHPELANRLRDLKVKGDGLVHLFVVGSTAALTTIEFEPG